MAVEETISARFRDYDVGPVDTTLLLRGVYVRKRRRTRLQLTSAAVTAVLCVAGVALALPGRHQEVLRVITDRSPSVTTPGLELPPLQPMYLPPGAVLTGDRVDEDGLGGVLEWSLPGEANASTIGALPLPASGDLSRHPATLIQLLYRGPAPPDDAALLAVLPPADPKFGFHRELLHLRGQTVYVTTDRDEVLQRLDWLERGRMYSLSCQRLFTDQGRSGVPLTELVRMFEGLR